MEINILDEIAKGNIIQDGKLITNVEQLKEGKITVNPAGLNPIVTKETLEQVHKQYNEILKNLGNYEGTILRLEDVISKIREERNNLIGEIHDLTGEINEIYGRIAEPLTGNEIQQAKELIENKRIAYSKYVYLNKILNENYAELNQARANKCTSSIVVTPEKLEEIEKEANDTYQKLSKDSDIYQTKLSYKDEKELISVKKHNPLVTKLLKAKPVKFLGSKISKYKKEQIETISAEKLAKKYSLQTKIANFFHKENVDEIKEKLSEIDKNIRIEDSANELADIVYKSVIDAQMSKSPVKNVKDLYTLAGVFTNAKDERGKSYLPVDIKDAVADKIKDIISRAEIKVSTKNARSYVDGIKDVLDYKKVIKLYDEYGKMQERLSQKQMSDFEAKEKTTVVEATNNAASEVKEESKIEMPSPDETVVTAKPIETPSIEPYYQAMMDVKAGKLDDIDKELWNDENFLSQAKAVNPEVENYLNKKDKIEEPTSPEITTPKEEKEVPIKDNDYYLEEIQKGNFDSIPQERWEDKSFIKQALPKNSEVYSKISAGLKDDSGVLATLYNNDKDYFVKHASGVNLYKYGLLDWDKCTKENALDCISWRPELISSATKWQDDYDVTLKAVKANPDLIKYASKDVFEEIEDKNPEILKHVNDKALRDLSLSHTNQKIHEIEKQIREKREQFNQSVENTAKAFGYEPLDFMRQMQDSPLKKEIEELEKEKQTLQDNAKEIEDSIHKNVVKESRVQSIENKKTQEKINYNGQVANRQKDLRDVNEIIEDLKDQLAKEEEKYDNLRAFGEVEESQKAHELKQEIKDYEKEQERLKKEAKKGYKKYDEAVDRYDAMKENDFTAKSQTPKQDNTPKESNDIQTFIKDENLTYDEISNLKEIMDSYREEYQDATDTEIFDRAKQAILEERELDSKIQSVKHTR